MAQVTLKSVHIRNSKTLLPPPFRRFLLRKKVIKTQYLLEDLKHLTVFNHACILEVYHSVYNKYCTKRLHFLHPAIVARTELATLDFNTGVGLEHAKTKKSKLRCKQHYSIMVCEKK